MRKLSSALITSFLALIFSCFSFAQESITITTYYPSPFGSYNQLQTDTLGVGDNNGNGSLDSGDVPTTTGDVWIEGNVGIGTMAPGQRLTLGAGNIFLPNANGGIDGNLYFGGITNTGNTGMRLFGGLVNGTTPAGYIDVRTTNLADGLRFRVDTTDGGTERMRITAAGNVGIGTASPARTLEVNGAAQSTDFYLSDGVQIQGLSGRNYFRDSEGAGNLRVGALWGMPGVYAESGVGAVGGAGGTSLQNNSLFVTTGGNVGIGTTNPAGFRLNVNGAMAVNSVNISGDLAMSGNISHGANTFTIQQQVGGSSAINFYRSGAPNARLYTDTGRWFVAASGGPGYNSPMPDLAEVFPLIDEQHIEAGDVVSIDPKGSTAIIKCTKEYDPLLVGIISTDPGMALGVGMPKDDPKTGEALPPEKIKPLSLVGRVPCKVSTINGPITAGDYLTSSSIPGYAMKATKAGPVIAKALENFSGPKSDKGKIMVFCNLGWWQPEENDGLSALKKEIDDLKKQIVLLKKGKE